MAMNVLLVIWGFPPIVGAYGYSEAKPGLAAI
jgi:hypothetical protein